MCVPMGWCILCGLRPCALYTEPVKRKIERIHAPTGSTSGVPGSEAGNMMHPVYVCACVQKARMHAHGIRWRCTVRANASSTHACMWRTHMVSCVSTGSCQGGDGFKQKNTRHVARWMYAFNVVRVVGFDKSALCAKEQILSQPQFLPGSLTRVSGPPACQTHSHMHRCTRRDMRPLGPTWGYVFVVTVAGRRKAPYFGRQTKLTNGATVSLRKQLPHRCSLLTASDALS
jgi:hypothetical protein